MFDRFTEDANQAMRLANIEVQRFGQEYLGAEHLLLGAALEQSEAVVTLWKRLDVDPARVRAEVEKAAPKGTAKRPVDLGSGPQWDDGARAALLLAFEEAASLQHEHFGCEHLLLGLIREEDGAAARVLDALGVNLETARAAAREVASERGG